MPVSRSWLAPSAAIIVAIALAGLPACGGPRQVSDQWPGGAPKRTGTLVEEKQEGDWTYWYANGQKQAAGAWVHDLQSGAWSWWYDNGKPKQSGQYDPSIALAKSYSAAHRTGHWQHWYDNGQRYAEGDYVKDRQDGTWSYFSKTGKHFAEGHFTAGAKDLLWSWHHEDGARKECGAFLEGFKVGPWTSWNADGSVKSESLYGAPASYRVVDERATTSPRWGTMRGGRREGVWLVWQDGRPRAVAGYAAGVPGTWQLWSDDATLAAAGTWDGDTPRIAAAWAASAPAGWSETLKLITAPAAPPAVAKADAPPPAAPKAPEPEPLPAPSAPALSPIQTAPTTFTIKQEASAKDLIEHYTKGAAVPVAGYDTSSFGGEEVSRQRRDLIGKPLPQTRFLSATGTVLELQDYIGKKPVLIVILRGFAGQVCLYCATQTAALSNSIQKFRDLGTEVIVIYPGPVEAIPAFIDAVQSLRKDPPPMPLGLDVSLALVRALGVEDNLSKPTSVIIDKQGLVRYAYVGLSIADRPAVNDLLQEIGRYVK